MKKLKHTTSLILGFLILVAFTLASCQKEEIIEEHSIENKVKSGIKIVKLTSKDITQNKSVTEKLNFFTETLKTRQQNKTVYSSEHDFYINTDFVTYIEKANGSHTYTFPVQYVEETGEINNLVLHSEEDSSYKAIYVSYDVTEIEKALINADTPINLEGKVSIAIINDAAFIDTLFSKVTTSDQCLEPDYSIGPCNAGYSYDHKPEPFSGYAGGMCSGSVSTLVNVGYDMDCVNAIDWGSPGSGTTNTGTSPNGTLNGGGLNSSDNAPLTTPVTCEGCPEIEEEEEEEELCLNSVQELTGFTPEMSTWLQSQSQSLINQIKSIFQVDSCSEESQKLVMNAIRVLMVNPDASPLIMADCRSFEYALPPGALQRGCAVSNFNHTFYTAGIRPNGSPYYGEIDIPVNLIYFTMPPWMTNGQAANVTAAAVTAAIKAADVYFFDNPDITQYQLATFFRDTMIDELAIIGGSLSTTVEPFPIPSPAPYLTAILGINNPFDC